MEYNEFQVAGFQLAHLLLAFVLSASFVFLLYWLWTWPCGESSQGATATRCDTVLPRQTVKPLYALELEPGIVVLQSEDGSFFRILREYESADKRGHGMAAHELPPGGAGANGQSGHYYLPSYTKAHFQTQPTAPLLNVSEGSSDPFGDGAPWAPIQTLGPN
ncbi:uncharacterized protein LOC101860237 [Aplysia californica]|uniref:Uncharacterized protein LOC101860237 n=1 Tax=Aplysia californica TaxID=6500 RepID=A0ABM0JFF1_APLCA|nr:uncharacterized protein LOC101860237 [Aplysia californica]